MDMLGQPGNCARTWPPPSGQRSPLPTHAREPEQRTMPRSPGSAGHGAV